MKFSFTIEEDQFAMPNTFRLNAMSKGINIGYIHVLTQEGLGGDFIEAIKVLTKYRNRGIGRALMEAALKRCKGTSVSLFPSPFDENMMDTSRLIDWYKTFGFEMNVYDGHMTKKL